MEILFQQYSLIRERRKTFFEYCRSLDPSHITHNLESFGGRSIGYVLVHMANTYLFWLGHFSEISKAAFAHAESCKNIDEIKLLFGETDALVNKFLKNYQPIFEQVIVNKVPTTTFEVALSPLQLYTHVITHEYHHKGQILSMSRHLGYTPIDTDLIRMEY